MHVVIVVLIHADQHSCPVQKLFHGLPKSKFFNFIIQFTLHFDKLLIRLKSYNIRYIINGCYTEALSYADDITISCPSIRGLNRILEICNTFAAKHNLIFTTKKSLGIKYGNPVCASETIYLGKNKSRWESSVCHLCNYFDTKLSGMVDCKMKCSSFIGSVNRVMANFGHLQSHILSQILRHTAAHFTDLRYGTLILKVLLKFV